MKKPKDPLCINCRHKRENHVNDLRCVCDRSTGGGNVSRCLCKQYQAPKEPERLRGQPALMTMLDDDMEIK